MLSIPSEMPILGLGSQAMMQKQFFAISDSDRKLIKENAHVVREALFSCITETQVECSVAFARVLNHQGINTENYWLFLRLLITNNPWVVEELMHDREPRLMFTTIKPDADLIEVAFQVLGARHPDELNTLSLEAVLGIIQNTYFDPDDGYRIRPLSIRDINSLGKFLLKDQPQDHPRNRLILEILDRMTQLGQYYGEPDKNILSKHAFTVRYAYFDRTRDLNDAIPEPLLVKLQNRSDTSPERDFADVVTERRKRKRDAAGRFTK
ncbi:hypothetical protein MASR2M78_24390 [Treponema sp.]